MSSLLCPPEAVPGKFSDLLSGSSATLKPNSQTSFENQLSYEGFGVYNDSPRQVQIVLERHGDQHMSDEQTYYPEPRADSSALTPGFDVTMRRNLSMAL